MHFRTKHTFFSSKIRLMWPMKNEINVCYLKFQFLLFLLMWWNIRIRMKFFNVKFDWEWKNFCKSFKKNWCLILRRKNMQILFYWKIHLTNSKMHIQNYSSWHAKVTCFHIPIDMFSYSHFTNSEIHFRICQSC